MLSNDTRLNALARKRLDELDRAFEYLTEPKKFRDFHELVNDKITLRTLEPGSLAASIARREGFDNKTSKNDAVETDLTEITDDGQPHITLAEERELLKELRRKRLEKAPKIGQKRLKQREKLIAETNTEIEQLANSTARAKASELVAKGYTDSDDFFEKVYAAALEVTQATRARAIRVSQDKDLPLDEKVLDEWDQAVLDKSEEAAEREYNNLEGVMATQKPSAYKGPKFAFRLVVTLVTVAAALVVFCNMNLALWTNQPDALGRQMDDKNPADSARDLFQQLRNLPNKLSANPSIATAEGLVSSAGTAGAAGAAMTMSIDGSADYNAGCTAITGGDFTKGIASFNNAISKNRNVYQYCYNRAIGWLSQGNYDAALQDFNAAITLRTDLMQARYNKGVIYLLGGADYASRANHEKDAKTKIAMQQQAVVNLRAAIIEFSTVAIKMPKLAQPLYNRALAKYRLGDLSGAVADFEAATKRDPKLEAAKYNLAIAKAALAEPNRKPPMDEGTIPSPPIGPQGPPAPGFF